MKLLFSLKYSLSLLIVMVLAGGWRYSNLPESIPTRFDWAGQPVSYSSREYVVLLMPVLYSLISLILVASTKLFPVDFSIHSSLRARDRIIFAIGLLLAGIHFGFLLEPGNQSGFVPWFGAGTALFMVIGGNVFGKLERNFVIGIRTPWTIASIGNWRETHRFTGRLFVIFGVFLVGLTLAHAVTIGWVIGLIITPAALGTIFSFAYYWRRERI